MNERTIEEFELERAIESIGPQLRELRIRRELEGATDNRVQEIEGVVFTLARIPGTSIPGFGFETLEDMIREKLNKMVY